MVANESIKSIQSSSLDDLANTLMNNLDRNKIFPPFYNDPEELINPSKIKTTGPPRPPNGFLLCRKNVHKQAKERGICNMRAISKVTGILWRSATPDEKEQYEKLAIEVQNLHSKRYPGYKYKPIARNNNNNNNNNGSNNNNNNNNHGNNNLKNDNNYNNINQIPTPITTPIPTPAIANITTLNHTFNNNNSHKITKKPSNLYHHHHHPYYIPQSMFVSNPIMPQQPIIGGGSGYEIPEFTQEDFQMLSLFL